MFALYVSFTANDALFLLTLAIGLISAILTDSFFTYLKTKNFTITESSIVSGLIIGCVLSGGQAWWMIALASVLAIGSKHLIRFKGRHIFNPAGFGTLAVVFLLGASTEWKGAYLWYIIIPFGFYFVSRIRKLEIVAGYFISFFILFGLQALIRDIHVLNILGYLNYFFIFIMLIEPMTTPVAYYAKVIFGAGAGALIFILYALGVREAELATLLCFNLLYNLSDSVSRRTVRRLTESDGKK